MSKENHGCKWTTRDEQLLTEMFWLGKSYEEMSKKLGRTWYSCKCRLLKLKLIPYEPQQGVLSVEKYDVPRNHVNQQIKEDSSFEFNFNERKDTSTIFSNSEIDIVISYFKSRLAKLAIQKLETKCFQKSIDISVAEDIFKSEIIKLRNLKNTPNDERVKKLFKIA